jgi:hypothetical protein
MSDSIEFQLKLQDQMSASLRSGAENALKLDAALTKLTGKLDQTEKAERKEQESEEGMFTRAVEKGERMKDIVEKIAEKVYELGERLIESTVEITDFGYKAEVAMRHLYGSTAEAGEKSEQMLKQAHQFALDAALPVDQVTEAFLGLKRAGLNDEWVRPLTAAAGDLAALTGHPEKFNELTDAFARMAQKGEVTSRDLMQLKTAGLNVGLMAKQLGAKDFTDLQKQLEKKPLGLYEGLRAIEDTILRTAHEKTLGDVLKEDSSTIGGSITKIKDAWSIMLDDVLNKKGSAFGDLRASFGKMVDDLIENLPQLEKQFTQTFGPIITAVDNFIKDPKAISNLFNEALGAIQAIASVIGPVIDAFKWLADHKETLKTAALTAGGAAVAGPVGAAAGAGLGLISASADALADREKKTVDEEMSHGKSLDDAIGIATRQQGALDKFDTGGPVEETGPAMVHAGEYVIPVGGAPVIQGSGGGRGGTVIHAPINVSVTISGGHDLTEQGIKLSLEETLPGQLVSPFEKLASTIGAG